MLLQWLPHMQNFKNTVDQIKIFSSKKIHFVTQFEAFVIDFGFIKKFEVARPKQR